MKQGYIQNNLAQQRPVFNDMTNFQEANIQQGQIQTKSSQRVIHGQKKMTSLLIFFIPLMLAAPLISYHMAVKKGQEHKYPHPTITDTACHYPQNIQFRLIMAGSGSFISMIYWVLFRWIKNIKQKTQYQGPVYGFLYYIGQASVWGYMIAMGTIDGKWYPDLHTNSAIFFFVTLFVIVMTQTLVIREMYQWDSSIISRKSYFIKMIFAIYVLMIWIYSVTGLVLQPPTPSGAVNDDQDKYIVILEWNSVYVCIFWILSFLPQWTDIRITLSEEKTQ